MVLLLAPNDAHRQAFRYAGPNLVSDGDLLTWSLLPPPETTGPDS